MESSRSVVTRRNERTPLTEQERATIDQLDSGIVAAAAEPNDLDSLAELRRALRQETGDALQSMIPDLDERSRGQAERYAPQLGRIKGTGGPLDRLVPRHVPIASDTVVPASGIGNLLGTTSPTFLKQPPHVGEFWWAETISSSSSPGNSLTLDAASAPNRIWGHVSHRGDDLVWGNAFVVHTFVLAPARMPRTDRTRFDLRPQFRHAGWVSGWTGLYHPIWHADDKWSKCWRFFDIRLMQSSGELLAADSLHQELFSLQNVNPVGQANINEHSGWLPILSFTANMAELRARGVSLILRMEFKYDFQLEGESDIWFRLDPRQEPDPTNALTVRFIPDDIKIF